MSAVKFVILHDDYTTIKSIHFTLARFPSNPDSMDSEIFTNKQYFDRIVDIAVGKAVQNAAMLSNKDRRREPREREE